MAFKWSIQHVAQEIITKKLEEDTEIRGKIESLIVDAVKLTVEKNREATVTKLADSISSWLTRDRY